MTGIFRAAKSPYQMAEEDDDSPKHRCVWWVTGSWCARKSAGDSREELRGPTGAILMYIFHFIDKNLMEVKKMNILKKKLPGYLCHHGSLIHEPGFKKASSSRKRLGLHNRLAKERLGNIRRGSAMTIGCKIFPHHLRWKILSNEHGETQSDATT